jgi:hypothetical protein
MGRVSRNVVDIPQGHLSIPKVRRKIFFRQEGLPFRGRNDLPLNQLLDRKDRLLPIGLLRFEKPIQSLPQIPPSLTLPLEGGGMGGGEFGNRSKTVETFFEIHR